MPKDRRENSSGLSSVPSSPNTSFSLPKNPLEDGENIKEWEDVRCPVCMEHPHNAILLMCSSHNKGCRPFMCDTSYRHSNCFDQFRNSFGEVAAVLQRPEDLLNFTSSATSSAIPSEAGVSDVEGERSPERSISVLTVPSESAVKSKLACPLCRGVINGWTVVKSARCFMNAKSRSCACETCDFSGAYTDLRKHARLEHPLVRPTEADPERRRNWRRLERQRDLGDLLSTLQSSIGVDETAEESTLTIDEGGWLTVFFLVRLIRPGNSSTRSRASRARAQVAMRRRSTRRLWGESYEGDSDSRQDDDESTETGPRRNVRRRLNPEDDNNESSGSGVNSSEA